MVKDAIQTQKIWKRAWKEPEPGVLLENRKELSLEGSVLNEA